MTTTTVDGQEPVRRVRLGFRSRVLGVASLLLIGSVAAGLFVERTVLRARLDRNVNAALEQEATELRELTTGRNPETAQPFAGDVRAIFDTFISRNVPGPGEAFVTFVDGQMYQRTSGAQVFDDRPDLIQEWATATVSLRGDVDTSEGGVRYLAVPLVSGGQAHGVFVAVNFIEDQRRAIDDDLRVTAIVVLSVVTAALFIAWATAGRLLRPLREVTATARSITETDLSRRIPVEGKDEVAELAGTFNQMLDRLEAAFAAQRAFVDDAGHELRTPITVIMGQLELMGDDPEDRARTLAIVDDELARMARIVEDLLLLAKAEQEDFVRTEPVELADFTTELFMKARSLGDRNWRLDEVADATAAIDAQRLTQAVLNLARNAVEASEPGAVIAIGSRADGDRVRLWVRDEGVGIAPEEQGRIFERFARGRHGRRRSDGAGLGLAIVTAVAEAHGGSVQLESQPGSGSTFTIDLPVVAVLHTDQMEETEWPES